MKRLLMAVSLLAMTAPAVHAQTGGTMSGMDTGVDAGDMEIVSDQYLVFFGLNESRLTPEAEDVVAKAASQYRETGAVRITATGHTDTSGSEQYNMALSLRRANAVKDQLVREGIPANQIVVVGRGESQPLVNTADGVREPQNRRVEIVLG